MSSRQTQPLKDSNMRVTQLDILYNPIAGGAGNPTNGTGDIKGTYTVITRQSTGAYTIVTNDKYLKNVGASVRVQSPTGTLGFATVTNVVKSGAAGVTGVMTLTFKVYSPLGVLTDANLTNGDALFLQWILQNNGRNQ